MIISSDIDLNSTYIYAQNISIVLPKKYPTTATKYSAKLHTKYHHKKEEASK